MTGYNSALDARLRKLEANAAPADWRLPGIRIICRDEADKERQIAEYLAAGLHPDTLFVCRLLISQQPRAA